MRNVRAGRQAAILFAVAVAGSVLFPVSVRAETNTIGGGTAESMTEEAVTAGTAAQESVMVWTAAQESGFTVEYGNLRELVKAGNPGLVQAQTDYDQSVKPYQDMWDALKKEQEYMEDMAEAYEDEDGEMAALYEENAKMLETSAGQINVRIRNLTSSSQTKALEKQADAYTLTAQTLMNSYNQMAQNVRAREKSVQAAQAAYEEALKKQAAGTAKASEAEQAKNTFDQQSNALATLREQAAQLKNTLLSTLGLSEREDVAIGRIPEPDLEAIRSIDFEADKLTAVSNDSALFNQRRASASGTDERALRDKKIGEAEAQAEMSIRSAYQSLMAELAGYEAALQSFEAASLNNQALQRKKQAGIVSNAEYLQGEASYIEKEAAKEIAAMSLYQAYETYLWQVKGVS